MDRIGGSKRFFRTARTRTHACFSFRISHKRRRCSLQYSVDGYLSELYWFGSFAINPPGTTSPASFPIRFGSRCPSYYPVPAFLFFMCGLSGHSFAGCKGRQNRHALLIEALNLWNRQRWWPSDIPWWLLHEIIIIMFFLLMQQIYLNRVFRDRALARYSNLSKA